MGETLEIKASIERISDLENRLRTTEKELEQVRESEKQYRLLIENANDAIFIIQDGEVKFSNPKSRTVGDPLSIDLSKNPFTNFIHAEDQDYLSDFLSSKPQTGKSSEGRKFRLANSDDEEMWVEMYKSSIQWKEQPATIYFLRDISASKKIEEQFQLSKKMEAIGTLAGGVAHNFNNLLQVIQGNISYLMLDDKFCVPYMEEISNIESSIETGANLAKQLLSFARAGDFYFKAVNINNIVDSTSNMFAHTCKTIKIHKYLQTNIWTVEVDVGQIELVMINFYINARHAMLEGGDLYLHTENIFFKESDALPYEKKSGKYIRISITDTGVGMDEKVKGKIFEPFFTTKEEGEGTGLGLSTAYGVIEQHGGFISFHTEKAKGSTFNIHLPASDKAIVPIKEALENLETGTGTILLVDDEDSIITIGKLLIQEMGYSVITAHGGRHAIEKFKENIDIIDMVILDIIMPDMDGGKVFDQIKELNQNVKVLLSSGYSKDGYTESILERGCDGFIQKPFTLQKLSIEIKKILTGSQKG